MLLDDPLLASNYFSQLQAAKRQTCYGGLSSQGPGQKFKVTFKVNAKTKNSNFVVIFDCAP